MYLYQNETVYHPSNLTEVFYTMRKKTYQILTMTMIMMMALPAVIGAAYGQTQTAAVIPPNYINIEVLSSA